MEWNYEDLPCKYHKIILKLYKNKPIVKESLKLWSMYGFLRNNPFKTSEDLRRAVLKNDKPIFTEKQARQIFKALKQKGGDEHPLIGKAIQDAVDNISGYVPVMGSVTNVVETVTGNIGDAVEEYPVLSLGVDAAKRGMSAASSGVNAVSTAAAGPVGAVTAVISVPLAAAAAAVDAVQGNPGDAFIRFLAGLPLLGSFLSKTLEEAEKFGKKVNKYREFLGETVLAPIADMVPQPT